MTKERPPEPIDFFIWTVQDVSLWLEEINLGTYRQVFRELGVNGDYLDGMSMLTTEQLLRFIRRCHMNWGDFITLCRELRRIKGDRVGSMHQVETPCAGVQNVMKWVAHKACPDYNEALRSIDLLYDTALISSGYTPEDPSQLGGKIYEMMSVALSDKWSTPIVEAQQPLAQPPQPETLEAELVEPTDVKDLK